ncbi:hypothetical protein GGR51DRAFT_539157 [Nemania sp. FL0031]|nr:hypothetical protein GGR51DRAFT_539157 [Nemania sp. FL0031]
MDPLSTTASVIAVLQLTTVVVRYLNDAKGASKDQKKCAIEASNLLALLTKLKCYLEEASPTDHLHIRARELSVRDGVLEQYKAVLELLVDKVVPKAGSNKVVTSLLWPFNKKQTEELLGTMERLKSLLLVDFQIDHFKLSRAIKEETTSIYSVVRAKQGDELSKAIVNWLSPVDFLSRQRDIKSRQLGGTGIWFLESHEFGDWVKGVSNTLVCPGVPGAGKTMLSSLVINRLWEIKDDLGAVVVFLYCNHKEDKDRKAIDSLSALLRQLIEESPRTLATVQALYEIHTKKNTQPSLSDISTIIRRVFEDYRVVFIVVDALDEYPDESRHTLLRELKNLQESKVRLMVTSRPIGTIIEQFENSVQLPIKAQGEDIKLLVESLIPRHHCISYKPELKQLVVATIQDVVVANGM